MHISCLDCTTTREMDKTQFIYKYMIEFYQV
jgi:hypothetical protein